MSASGRQGLARPIRDGVVADEQHFAATAMLAGLFPIGRVRVAAGGLFHRVVAAERPEVRRSSMRANCDQRPIAHIAAQRDVPHWRGSWPGSVRLAGAFGSADMPGHQARWRRRGLRMRSRHRQRAHPWQRGPQKGSRLHRRQFYRATADNPPRARTCGRLRPTSRACGAARAASRGDRHFARGFGGEDLRRRVDHRGDTADVAQLLVVMPVSFSSS